MSGLPIHTEVLTTTGWKTISDITTNHIVASVNTDDMKVQFTKVLEKSDTTVEDTFMFPYMELPLDQQILYRDPIDKKRNETVFGEFIEGTRPFGLPLAATFKTNGIPLSLMDIEFIIYVQKYGKIIHNIQGGIVSIEFGNNDQTNVFKTKMLLTATLKPFNETDNVVCVKDSHAIELIETYLDNKKQFTWEWLSLTMTQYFYLRSKLDKNIDDDMIVYENNSKQNIDVIQALSATKNTGSVISGDNNSLFFVKEYMNCCDDINTATLKSKQNICGFVTDNRYVIARQFGMTMILSSY